MSATFIFALPDSMSGIKATSWAKIALISGEVVWFWVMAVMEAYEGFEGSNISVEVWEFYAGFGVFIFGVGSVPA